jgi:Uncharacterised protein family (UPF0149)
MRENHQGHPVKPQPLTDAEFERLNGLLGRFDNKRPMNLEQLGGFLAALICGPEIVRPSEYLPVAEAIWFLRTPSVRSPCCKIFYL